MTTPRTTAPIRRPTSLPLLVLLAALGCGGGTSSPDAGTTDAVADGTPADAAPDATPTGAILRIVENLTTWDFGDVATGEHSVALALTITNDGATTSGTLDLSVTGAAPAAFALDATTDCDDGIVLAPGATCTVRIRFAPTALGARTATLAIDAGGGDLVAVELSGTGVSSSITMSPAPLDVGPVHAGAASATAVATIKNIGLATATLVSLTATGPGYTLDATSCSGTLGPSETCTATVRFTPTAIGAVSGDLAIDTDLGMAGVPITGTGTGAINVTNTSVSGGTGTVTSTPGGIACGATCAALFSDLVVLTVSPGANTGFTGWTGACSGVGPCMLTPTVADQNVTATFTGQSVLTITGAGTATGAVFVEGVACALPCTRAVSSGTTLHLDAFSASSFSGWAGACSGTDPSCAVTVTGNLTATATFDLDTGEVWTRTLAGVPLERTVFASDGTVMVAGHDPVTSELVVAKYATTGMRAWLVRFPSTSAGRAVGMAADVAGGAVVVDYQHTGTFGFANVVVRDVSTTGGTTWIDTVPNARWSGAGFVSLDDAIDAAGAGGVVIALETATGALVRSYDAAGTALWTGTSTMAPFDVAVASTGVVHVMLDDGAAFNTLGRWTSTGSALTDLIVPAPGSSGSFYDSLDIDASDRLLMTAVPDVNISRLRAISLAGATVWTAGDVTRDDGVAVVAVPGAGALVLDVFGTIPSLFSIASYNATGAPGGTRTVIRSGSATTTASDLMFAHATAGNTSGNAVVVGDWAKHPTGATVQSHDGFVRFYAP